MITAVGKLDIAAVCLAMQVETTSPAGHAEAWVIKYGLMAYFLPQSFNVRIHQGLLPLY
jgi:hypothetical protein